MWAMTLREIYTAIEGVAQQVPCIKTTLENDVLRLNEMVSVQYGVFAIVPGTHSGTDGWMTYSLNLFYIDRLTNDQDNETEIQSHAIEVLRAILMRVNEEAMPVNDGVRYTAFTRRFQDLCAGAWAEVSVQTPVGDCNDIFNE